MASGPLDREAARAEARVLQDSLLTVVPADSFQAQWHGHPFDSEVEDATFSWRYRGAATYRIDRGVEDEGRPVTVRFSLRDKISGRYEIVLEGLLAPSHRDAGSGAGALKPGTYTQREPTTYPTVSAELVAGRHRFFSRSGTLTVTRVADGRVRGTFFFEMVPRDEAGASSTETAWFSLIGAFDAQPAP